MLRRLRSSVRDEFRQETVSWERIEPRGESIPGRGIAFLFEETALEGQVRLLGHRRLEAREDFPRRRGVAVQQVDRGHRQELRRGQIAVLRLVDPPIRTMRL